MCRRTQTVTSSQVFRLKDEFKDQRLMINLSPSFLRRGKPEVRKLNESESRVLVSLESFM